MVQFKPNFEDSKPDRPNSLQPSNPSSCNWIPSQMPGKPNRFERNPIGCIRNQIPRKSIQFYLDPIDSKPSTPRQMQRNHNSLPKKTNWFHIQPQSNSKETQLSLTLQSQVKYKESIYNPPKPREKLKNLSSNGCLLGLGNIHFSMVLLVP